MSSNLALKIRNLIEQNNLTIKGLERQSGLKVNSVRNIITGSSKKPSADTLLAIARTLNCSVEELLNEELKSNNLGQNLKEEAHLNFECANHKLLLEVSCLVIELYQQQKEKVNFKNYAQLLKDIYEYSEKNNNGAIDSAFAEWLFEKHK